MSSERSDELPGVVAGLVRERLGQPVCAVHHAEGVFASDIAGVLVLADGARVFVKASYASEHAADYRTEAVVAAALPGALSTPALRFWGERAGWLVLCFDAVAGEVPGQPWQASAVRAVLESMAERARLLTPSPLRSLRGLPELLGGTGRFAVWRDLTAGRQRALSPDRLTRWQADRLGWLAGWEAGWEDAVAGDALLHFDPRADNYLIGPGSRAWVLDWSRACTGAPWVDAVTFLCSAAADGHDPQPLFAGHPTAAHAPPGAVNALLAALAGYWAEAAQLPGGAPSLRGFQGRSAVGACRWLRDRTGG